MGSPQPPPKPVLRLNTDVGRHHYVSVPVDAPLRPRASTRGSPIESIGSTPPFLSPPNFEPGSSESDDECSMRGRFAANAGHARKTPRFILPQSPGRRSAEFASDDTPLGEQENLLTDPESAEQFVKEPSPPERVHTNLFGMLASSVTFNEMSLSRFGGHRDTLATLALRRVKHSDALPIEVFSHIVRYLDFETYKSVRLTCRCWSAAFTYVRPLRLPPVYSVPAEILSHVFQYLLPLELNAVRHTCRRWMMASLEYRLLAKVLRRNGFWSSVAADKARNEEIGHPVGGEWRLSKRLATECSLISGWTGNGFTGRPTVPPSYQADSSNASSPGRQQTSPSLVLSSTIDFAGLSRADHVYRGDDSLTLHYTVSICGMFLLVHSHSIVNVYCIQDMVSPTPHYRHGGLVQFLIGIACPSSILAVSMDTSKGRYSIAVLLDDRRGLIIDIPELDLMARRSSSSSPNPERDTHNVSHTWDIKPSPCATPTTTQRPMIRPMYTDIYHDSPVAKLPLRSQPSPTPVQFIPHTLYRNLCSKTSPPITVTICPERRCVAFGSSAGIELHWQDARTGQELSRWMELIGPAEYIHFLPLRNEDDKNLEQYLRLISSRASPIYYYDIIDANEAWKYENAKFLRAVPLSDGNHVLYTDPSNGELCLGTGLSHSFGTSKPIRRFVLEGPQHRFEDKARWPKCYRSGTELRWGARVIAGFGDAIWLFCIPPDWLAADAQIEGFLWGEVQRRDNGLVVVHGVQVGSIPGLVELAIDASDGEVTIFAFSDCAPAQVYQIGRYLVRGVRERFVATNGRVLDREDCVGDSATRNSLTSIYEAARWAESDDRIKSTEYQNLNRHQLPISKADEDSDGDIEMRDFAVGDWIHNTQNEDEGYASDLDNERAKGLEGNWDVGAGDESLYESSEAGWPGRADEWPVMELVRLEVEVVCGG
ncbi:MAG: hypothetical protein Q9181_002868 [Wetmoreana brouardii]